MNISPDTQQDPVGTIKASRRNFLRQAGSLCMGTVVFSSICAVPGGRSEAFVDLKGEKVMKNKKNNFPFSKHVGEHFTLRSRETDPVRVKLIEVVDRSPMVNKEGSSAKQECFSMVFRGPRDSELPQNTYTFSNSKMGNIDLFIVPIGADEKNIQYEAIINRILT